MNALHQEWLDSVSGTYQHVVAAYDFSNFSGCVQLINGPTHRLGDCLDLLLIDASGVGDCIVDPPLGKSDHSNMSFTLQLGFCIPSITFLSQVYLKSRVDWSRICQDLQDS